MEGTNSGNRPIGTGMIHTGPFADTAAAAAAAAAAAQRTQQHPATGSSSIPPAPPPLPPNNHALLAAPPSTPLSPPPILHSRGLSPDDLESSGTLAATANLSAVQQPILNLSLTGVTFSGGQQRLAPSGGGGGVSPPGSSPDSEAPGQGGGWRQMQRQQHDYQFGPRGGTMNTNPSAPPSKRRRTVTEAFGDMSLSLSQRRGMAGLDLATPSNDVGGGGGGRHGFGGGAGSGASSTRSLGDFGGGLQQQQQQQQQDGETFAFSLGAGHGAAGSGRSMTANNNGNRPSRPSPIAGLNGAGPMQHIGFSSVASQSSPGLMRRSVGSSGGATPSEETIEDDTEDSLDVARTIDGTGLGTHVAISPYTIAAPTALPPKPDSNVVRITSSDMESASETASEMDEGVFDGFPPLTGAAGPSDKPKNLVDAKIEELIRRDRMKAMIQARLEAAEKKAANGGSIKTRDDFDYQGTFTTAGSVTWRKSDAVMGNTPADAAAAAATSITPISIPAAKPPQNPASTPGMVPSAAAAAAAAAATVAMPPPAPVATNHNPNPNPNSGDTKIPPGIERGRSTERRSSRGSRSRSLPRQYMKMAPQPNKGRDVSMASASSAATSGAGDDASDMDL